MKREALKAEKRTLTGKQVKKLRKDGILPANIYGKNFTSTSIQVSEKDFEVVYGKAHETGLVDLSVGSEMYPVLIQNVQRNPISHIALHIDFYKVNLKEKVKTAIPVVAIGEAKAVTDKIGGLMQPLNEVEIEALPADLPENIEVNVEGLAEIDAHITVGDLTVPSGVTILTEPDQTVFRISELVSKEAEELEAQEEAEAAEAAAESEAAEDTAEEKAEAESAKKEEDAPKESAEKSE